MPTAAMASSSRPSPVPPSPSLTVNSTDSDASSRPFAKPPSSPSVHSSISSARLPQQSLPQESSYHDSYSNGNGNGGVNNYQGGSGSTTTTTNGQTPSPSSTNRPPPPPHVPVPSEPLPDSLLCRSTFAALEHSAGTLKRLAKTVLTASAAYVALLEQLETAEDELLSSLGELGRWLEGGYGVQGDVFDTSNGIRKVARQRRAREREDLQEMVLHSLSAVKGEIKRQGLAGAGSQQHKFESVAKQYYQDTSAYLSASSGLSATSTSSSADVAQATRAAQFDLARYNHHSTLLYAVPPSSVVCLDLLVGMYGWVGSLLSQVPGKRADTHPPPNEPTNEFGRSHAGGVDTPTQRGRQLAVSETPVRLLSRDDASARGSFDALTRSLTLSLAHLHHVRNDLLQGWAAREQQTTVLENGASKLSGNGLETPRPRVLPTSSTDLAALNATASKEHKGKKINKILGGRKIRGLFSSTNATLTHLPSAQPLVERAPPVSSASVPPFPYTTQSLSPRRSYEQLNVEMAPITPDVSPTMSDGCDGQLPVPPRPPRSSSRQAARHSIQPGVKVYRSPFLPADSANNAGVYDIQRSVALADTAAKLTSDHHKQPSTSTSPSIGGVGGLSGMGDEDEQRELAGRKKEGVLWGTGTWEELEKGGTKGKWDRIWVVLAHSKMYEYKDAGPNKPESASTVIDLKFASVREGRNTDRRFVFEIVTPSHGRRLYQAMSESDMKMWIYALCNAIEACINGTSTLRSLNDVKELAADAAAEDEDLILPPVRKGSAPTGQSDRRLPIPPAVRGGPSNASRHSLPAPPRGEASSASRAQVAHRQSLKNRIKSSAELAGDKLGGGKATRNSMDLQQRPAFMQHAHSFSHRQEYREEYHDAESDIERRVYEMAGIQREPTMGSSISGHTSVAHLPQYPDNSNLASLRTLSPVLGSPGLPPGFEDEHDRPEPIKLDKRHLRQIAETGANARCADCGKRTKSSRWATQSLRDIPMVMFLCIRCCGLHRGLGTHISKPRSVDLDNWAPEMIQLAQDWGNARGNAFWERNKPIDWVPNDEDIQDYIQAKYVEARWVAEQDRDVLGL